jgi:hypothetical protein
LRTRWIVRPMKRAGRVKARQTEPTAKRAKTTAPTIVA